MANNFPIPTRAEIEAFIRSAAEEMGLDGEMHIRQCKTESGFNVLAHNKASDCYGLFQLSPIAVLDLKQRANLDIDRTNWRQNVVGGLTLYRMYLREMGHVEQALAAYNCGTGTVKKLLKKHGANWKAHLPAETKAYLPKILTA